ncbi:DeoR/GlpR family DNA-binding transcription regulator [Pengzhenrongella frigida]|uniref:DeoR/GlpR transcriptional regulator n=1 Tax=Pengzhenrongella frigida TaxID=1259133 RepID=A0A4Q5N433_9MICO|nr:DeoR/GlpR family DNA-binding transcription regulator [Cellulomonas sp. HLT2-17]RYV52970.1 DeoR/GlpR transcriptional regulator [Cellulomonas sp. HLT2-17]
MLSSTRHDAILSKLRADGEVSVQTLVGELRVSASTIRRDLDLLSEDGLLRRVRGGGSRVEPDAVAFREVSHQASAEKDEIAAHAATLVPDHSVVLIDIGTTTARLAHHLRGRRLTVITSSLAVVDELRDEDSIELIVLGGVLRNNYLSLVGMLTEQALGQLRAHICFLSGSGIRADGAVMDTTGIEVPVKRAMLAAAERTILLADRTKFPGTGLLPVCGPDRIAVLVTNQRADPATLATYRAVGTEVITV